MQDIEDVLQDPAVTYWLKRALESSLQRDPVDALRDAEFLVALLAARCDRTQHQAQPMLKIHPYGAGGV